MEVLSTRAYTIPNKRWRRKKHALQIFLLLRNKLLSNIT